MVILIYQAAPLPDDIWERLDEIPPNQLPVRILGPPSRIIGTGFFEYFSPLMVILGDIIELHHYSYHPRFGVLDRSSAVEIVKQSIRQCEVSIGQMSLDTELDELAMPPTLGLGTGPPSTQDHPDGGPSAHHPEAFPPATATGPAQEIKNSPSSSFQVRLVVAYSTHILHVLQVLLYGKWDPIAMLDNEDDWISSPGFTDCASHAIAASEAVSTVLALDPELTFIPYLFGIYLLHGSFIPLLFADRMPQLGGPNQGVERICETIIRAHEVCVVTLSTEFQVSTKGLLAAL